MESSHFFICHYKPNTERRNYLFKNFIDSHKCIRWITEYDREEIEPVLDKYYQFSEQNFLQLLIPQLHILIGHSIGLVNPNMPWNDCFVHAQNWIKSQGNNIWHILPKPFLPKKLLSGDVSICLKHQRAWECIVESGMEYGCVLEDDFIVKENTIERLYDLLKYLPKEWDYIDIAGGAGLQIREENPTSPNLYQVNPPRGRTACGYLISRIFCEKILQLKLPVTLMIDWQLNYLFLSLAAKVFWIEPTIFIHGSETGIYQSNRDNK